MGRSLLSARRRFSLRRENVAAVLLLGALASGCAAAPTADAPKQIAKVEKIDGTIGKITLTDQAASRIGIKTSPVRAVAGDLVIPYSALIYDVQGESYTYTNPRALVYERHSIRIKSIRGDQVVLSGGPAAGTSIVSVGASQLLGIELGIGS